MKTKISISLGFLIVFSLFIINIGCDKDDKKDGAPIHQNQEDGTGDAKITVTFTGNKKSGNKLGLTKETPMEYIIALKSATLIGEDESDDFELFNKESLSNSIVYDFKNDDAMHNLNDDEIPDNNYIGIRFELYYLQMRIHIFSIQRGLEHRNMRIYFSEDGEHRPGDVTQINEDGVEIGWLFGTGIMPDFDPVTPRTYAYTVMGQGTDWFIFDDKSAEFYGPFGNMAFWNQNDSQPFVQEAYFYYQQNSEKNIIVDFNVIDCWQFEDKTGDGYFGGDDVTYDENPTAWAMLFPKITVNVE